MDPRDLASLTREEKEAAAMDLCGNYYMNADDDSPCARAVRADARSLPFLDPGFPACIDQIEYCTEKQLDGYLSADEES